MEAAKKLAAIANWTQACLALGVARVSAYRFWKRKENPVEPREPFKPERSNGCLSLRFKGFWKAFTACIYRSAR